ncbi:hypothetical protein GEMRC1_013486 [Eukaryota sp. GEM-RC1]
MTKPKTLDNSPGFNNHPGTLHKSYRKRELERITEENHAILRRIQHRQPTFSQSEWREHSQRHSKYEKNLREILPRTERGSLQKPRKKPRDQGETAPADFAKDLVSDHEQDFNAQSPDPSKMEYEDTNVQSPEPLTTEFEDTSAYSPPANDLETI